MEREYKIVVHAIEACKECGGEMNVQRRKNEPDVQLVTRYLKCAKCGSLGIARHTISQVVPGLEPIR